MKSLGRWLKPRSSTGPITNLPDDHRSRSPKNSSIQERLIQAPPAPSSSQEVSLDCPEIRVQPSAGPRPGTPAIDVVDSGGRNSLGSIAHSLTSKATVPDIVPHPLLIMPHLVPIVPTQTNPGIQILWPGASRGHQRSSVDDDDIVMQSLPNPVQKISEKDFAVPQISEPAKDEGKKSMQQQQQQQLASSPHSSTDTLAIKDTKPLSASQPTVFLPADDVVSYSTAGAAAAKSTKTSATRRGRQAGSKQRWKTLGGVSLTDDEKLDDRRGPSPHSEDEGQSRLRRRRKEGRRSSSLTEKTRWKLGGGAGGGGDSGAEDFQSSNEVLQPSVGTRGRGGDAPAGSGSIPVSRLDEFVLLASDDLEENMEFVVTRADSVAGVKGGLSMPGRDALAVVNSYKRQLPDSSAIPSNIALLYPYVNRYSGPRFTSSSKDVNKQATELALVKTTNVDYLVSIRNGPVQMSQGVQVFSRYLFLFPQVLFIAKQKSVTLFKLKKKIPLTDIWLDNRVDDVSDVVKYPDRSLVIGWPILNMVVSFATAGHKQTWRDMLEKEIEKAKSHADPSHKMNLKIICREKEFSVTKSLSIANNETAAQIVQRCLNEFHLKQMYDSQGYQLWVVSGYVPLQPLFGHEFPYAIEIHMERETHLLAKKKMNSLRQNVNSSSNGDCHFMLCEKRLPTNRSSADTPRKPTDRAKSPLVSLFRRTRTEVSQPTPKLFGRRLSEVCVDDKLPAAIMDLLQFLYIQGPASVGVFRKTANVKMVSDVRAKLDAGEGYQLTGSSVSVAAGTLKEYLRALPDCLLVSDMYGKWMEVFTLVQLDERKDSIRGLVSMLPRGNDLLLRHMVCVLRRISENAELNKMTSFNLATCIGPSLLWSHPYVDKASQISDVELIRELVVILVDYAEDIFSRQESVLLFKYLDAADVIIKPDTLASDSESLHSMLRDRDMNAQSNISLESDERDVDAFDTASKKPANLSPTSISRDSGLSNSNPQLYEEDPTSSHTIANQTTPEEAKRFSRHPKVSKLPRNRPPKLSDISEGVGHHVSADDNEELKPEPSVPAERALTPGSGRMGASRTARERINRFQNSKSTSGDSVMGSLDDQYYISSDDDLKYVSPDSNSPVRVRNGVHEKQITAANTTNAKESTKEGNDTLVLVVKTETVFPTVPDSIPSSLKADNMGHDSDLNRHPSTKIIQISNSPRGSFHKKPKPLTPKEVTAFPSPKTKVVELNEMEFAFISELLQKAEEDAARKAQLTANSPATDSRRNASNQPGHNAQRNASNGDILSTPELKIKFSKPEVSNANNIRSQFSSSVIEKPHNMASSPKRQDSITQRHDSVSSRNESEMEPITGWSKYRHSVSGALRSDPKTETRSSVKASEGTLVEEEKTRLARRHTDNAARIQRKKVIRLQEIHGQLSPDYYVANKYGNSSVVNDRENNSQISRRNRSSEEYNDRVSHDSVFSENREHKNYNDFVVKQKNLKQDYEKSPRLMQQDVLKENRNSDFDFERKLNELEDERRANLEFEKASRTPRQMDRARLQMFESQNPSKQDRDSTAVFSLPPSERMLVDRQNPRRVTDIRREDIPKSTSVSNSLDRRSSEKMARELKFNRSDYESDEEIIRSSEHGRRKEKYTNRRIEASSIAEYIRSREDVSKLEEMAELKSKPEIFRLENTSSSAKQYERSRGKSYGFEDLDSVPTSGKNNERLRGKSSGFVDMERASTSSNYERIRGKSSGFEELNSGRNYHRSSGKSPGYEDYTSVVRETVTRNLYHDTKIEAQPMPSYDRKMQSRSERRTVGPKQIEIKVILPEVLVLDRPEFIDVSERRRSYENETRFDRDTSEPKRHLRPEIDSQEYRNRLYRSNEKERETESRKYVDQKGRNVDHMNLSTSEGVKRERIIRDGQMERQESLSRRHIDLRNRDLDVRNRDLEIIDRRNRDSNVTRTEIRNRTVNEKDRSEKDNLMTHNETRRPLHRMDWRSVDRPEREMNDPRRNKELYRDVELNRDREYNRDREHSRDKEYSRDTENSRDRTYNRDREASRDREFSRDRDYSSRPPINRIPPDPRHARGSEHRVFAAASETTQHERPIQRLPTQNINHDASSSHSPQSVQDRKRVTVVKITNSGSYISQNGPSESAWPPGATPTRARRLIQAHSVDGEEGHFYQMEEPERTDPLQRLRVAGNVNKLRNIYGQPSR